jgi:hypothetical protein
MSLLGSCFLVGPDASPAHADFLFGTPTNLGAPVNSSAHEYAPCVSPNGLELYFARGEEDIWVARRATPDSAWGPPTNLGPVVNVPGYDDGRPNLSADGLTLYFDSVRPGGYGVYDLYMTTRATLNDDWGPPVNLGATVNAGDDWAPCISADGLELYFTSLRPDGYGGQDLWVTRRASVQDNWGRPVNLGATINTPSFDGWPSISADGLLLFLVSNRPGGYGNADFYVARRATQKDPWGSPVNLGPMISSTALDHGGMISADGSMFYFDSLRPGGSGGVDLWQAPILPVVDFNGDGKVDAKDMGLLADDWGKSTSVCDIGPFAWGDGVVDEKDLGVLMESLMTPGPNASDVVTDVILNWVSPSFAQACDVYLGTSQVAVSSASRTNPQGVLVGQGQTASTYDSPSLLEFSKTYYWRVDFAITGPSPTILKGPVLKFTTAALTYPIKNVTATASSAQRGNGPEKTVDGSGLDKNDGHSINGTDMWWSLGKSPNWIQYEFDRVYVLHELWVWNSNQVIEPLMGFGARTVKTESSTDGTTWTALANVPEFARAPGKPGYTANTIVSFAAVPAKFVKLTIEKNWGVAPQTGLSEVRFFCIQSLTVPKP